MKTWLSSLGAVLSAVGASACCWIPAVLGAGAASSIGISQSITALRPVLLVLSILMLSFGLYRTYKRSGECCDSPAYLKLRRRRIVTMWVLTICCVSMMVLPQLRGVAGSTKQGSGSVHIGVERRLQVNGVTCESCVPPLITELNNVRGVNSAEFNFTDRIATVYVSDPPPKDSELMAAITKAGYTGFPLSIQKEGSREH